MQCCICSITKHGLSHLLLVVVERNTSEYFSQTMATERPCHLPIFATYLIRHG